ncbi:MAG: o-succinylbenzoate--CoA ligase [Sporichthyaceae bacterium]
MLPALAAALRGDGPALLPLPTGGTRGAVTAALRPDLPLESDDVALVVPTSGSTGEPKGVLLTADALRHSVFASQRRLGGPGQWLLALPVTHIAGLAVLLRSLAAGTRPEVLDLYGGFDAGAFSTATERLDADGRRYTALVPTQLHRLLDAGTDLTSYDAILLGGAAAPAPLVERAAAAGARVVVTYGMSETCGGCVYDGMPLDDVDVAVGDDGRITIGGPVVFAGYRLRPDLTANALVGGRFVTSDLGRIDELGRLTVLGRTDDVIVSGGVNVSASRVEHVLGAHPRVRAVAVVGQPDDQWGERVVAVVQAVTSADVPTLDELRSFGADQLEPAALPKELVVLGMLPMLDSGKPDRTAVLRLVAERAGQL